MKRLVHFIFWLAERDMRKAEKLKSRSARLRKFAWQLALGASAHQMSEYVKAIEQLNNSRSE